MLDVLADRITGVIYALTPFASPSMMLMGLEKPHSPMNLWIHSDVAAYLHCHTATIYRFLARRDIPAFHLGSDWRFRRSDINAWIEAQYVSPKAEKIPAGRKGRKRKGA